MMTKLERRNYFGEPRDIKRNTVLYFFDGVTFMPSLALLSMTTVIPYFLETLQASTFEFAIAASITTVGMLVGKPIFGSMATRAKSMTKTFAKVLFAQRLIFLSFVLMMPLFAGNQALMIWMFIVFWGIYNVFMGSGFVFSVSIIFKLFPPDKRAGMRGVGQAVGNLIALGMAGLIPTILVGFSFPYNFMAIFLVALAFLFLNTTGFLLMKEHEDVEPRVGMRVLEYIKELPVCLREDSTFRAMVLSCMFLVLGVSLIPFYTLYGIRTFELNVEQIALLTTLAIGSALFTHLVFGFIIDRLGAVRISPIIGVIVLLSGLLIWLSSSILPFYLAWVLINVGNHCYMKVANLMLGDVAPPRKVALYVGVLFIISMSLSSLVVLVLAPILEFAGFGILFGLVTVCGGLGLFYNIFVFQKRLKFGRM